MTLASDAFVTQYAMMIGMQMHTSAALGAFLAGMYPTSVL